LIFNFKKPVILYDAWRSGFAEMNAKKVWAIIFIVVGVTFVLKGFVNYSAVSFFGDEMELMNQLMEKNAGSIPNELYNIKHSREVIRNGKAGQLIIIALGIISASLGTGMLKKKNKPEIEDDFEDIDELLSIKDRWHM